MSTKISELNAVSKPINNDIILPAVQDGETKKVTALDLSNSSTPWTYKTQTGLRRWFQNLGAVGKDSAGNGLGGVDVVCMGDSLTEGVGATNGLYDNYPHRLKVKLQNYYNPEGVLGGFGFLPTYMALTGPINWWTMEGTPNYSDNSFGLGFRRLTYNPATGQRIRYAFDGSLDDYFRQGVTDLEFAAMRAHLVGPITYDISPTDAFVTPGTGTIATGTDTMVGIVPSDYGYRGTRLSGLTATATNCLQLSTPSEVAWYCGAFAYNGDYDCGVRVHNVGNGGQSARSAVNITSGMTATVDPMGTQGAGARNAKLFIINYITNDIGTGVNAFTTRDEFKSNYQTVINRVLALPSKPCVLLLIPPARNNTNYVSNVPDYIDALYELADENDHVAIANFWEMLDNSLWTDTTTDLGWNHADGTHFTDTGYEAQATEIARILGVGG